MEVKEATLKNWFQETTLLILVVPRIKSRKIWSRAKCLTQTRSSRFLYEPFKRHFSEEILEKDETQGGYGENYKETIDNKKYLNEKILEQDL